LIDVAFDRLGDATGGGFVRLVLIFVPAAIGTPVILALAMTASIGAIVAASQLNRWYVRSLEKSLVKRAGGVMRSREEESLAASALATLCCGGNATATLVTDGTARVTQEYAGGRLAVLELPLPSVVGVQSASAPPRYVSMSRLRQAMTEGSTETLGVSVEAPAGAPIVVALSRPEPQIGAKMLEGDGEQVAEQIAAILRERRALVR